jgi:hypothetical protein
MRIPQFDKLTAPPAGDAAMVKWSGGAKEKKQRSLGVGVGIGIGVAAEGRKWTPPAKRCKRYPKGVSIQNGTYRKS